MSEVQNNFMFSFLVVLLAVTTVESVSVTRICGRVEIERHHERPKVFHITEIKHAKFNLSDSLLSVNTFTRNPQQTQFYQLVKKQSKRIWHGSRLSKKQRKVMNMLWTRSEPRYEGKVGKLHHNPKKHTETYTYHASAPNRKTVRSVKKIKRQDTIQYSQKTIAPVNFLENISRPQKNVGPRGNLTSKEKYRNKKLQFVQYLKKKRNLPRLAPFTTKPFKSQPTLTGFRQSYLPLTALGNSFKNIHHTAMKSLHNKLPGDEGKLVTKSNRHRKISFFWASDNVMELTTVKDRVKFFETYDQFTAGGKRKRAEIENFDMTIDIKPKENAKVFLDDVNEDMPHIDDNFLYSKRDVKRDNRGVSDKVKTVLKINEVKAEQSCCKKQSQITINEISKSNKFLKGKQNGTGVSLWEKYPFAAVYIYEPSQVHCDAASLSPHWLVTGGACLYRRQRDISSGEQSAFITYCGANWRTPERIAYVKQSLVHPEYHPRDPKRRRQFNIGLVRVEYSLQLSCPGWSSVTLLSTPFVADPKGSPATAVGWGLDSYAGLDSTTDLARLMRYDGKIYTEVCPANPEFSKLVQLNPKPNLDTDVYCLPLPRRKPNVEEDPLHGNLLMSGGKLIGLYYTEEQRPWAEPWAQYTSIWRLAPWVRQVAREPKGSDNITIIDI